MRNTLLIIYLWCWANVYGLKVGIKAICFFRGNILGSGIELKMRIFTVIVIIFLARNTAALKKNQLDASKQLYKAIKEPSISPESDVDEYVAAHRLPRNDASDDGNDIIVNGTRTHSPLPTTPPIVIPRKCLQTIEKYIRGTNCTAGVNITAAIFSSQDKSLNASEYRKFLTQFCPSQKCLNMLTKVLNTCLKAHGLPMKNRTEVHCMLMVNTET